MALKYNSPVLLHIGIAVSVLMLIVIAWGQFKKVDVPRRPDYPEPLVICAVDSNDGPAPVDELRVAVTQWNLHGYDVQLSCGLDANTTLFVDRTVDERASVDDTVVRHGVTTVTTDAGGVIQGITIRVLVGASDLVLAHEIGHALGFQHPVACPSGHLMHPHKNGWDWRGLE